MQNFTLFSDYEFYGSFYSKYPIYSARKIFSRLSRNSHEITLEFIIKNVKTGKLYKYRGNKTKLDKEINVHFKKNNGFTVKKYKFIIKRID